MPTPGSAPTWLKTCWPRRSLAAFGRRERYDGSRADARPWLYGIAIRQIGRHRRAETEAGDFGDRSAARDRLAAAMSIPPRPARYRRRPLVLAGSTAGAGTLAASAILLSAGGSVSGQAPRAVHVNLADWSVNTNPNDTVTVKTKNISHPRRLEHVLAEAGIPALVRWGELCRAPRSQYLPTRGIVDGPDYVGGIAPGLDPRPS